MKRGFTIVELLIVVVVIAILASVTAVAFNGISKRAANASVQAALGQSEKALRMYKATEDKPLYMSDASLAANGVSGNQYYLGDNGMKGVCLGGDWPTPVEMGNIINTDFARGVAQGSNPEYMYWFFCSYFVNTPHAKAMYETIRDSKAASYFAKMPSTSNITIKAKNTDNSVSEYTQRGIRYAYNGSVDSPLSYLYYAINGKSCFTGDQSIRFSSTMSPGVGPGGYFTGFTETGGDYTADDTQYCVRTFKW